eukprot:9469903-Pyramimonas_sp.AAC.3
MAPSQPGSDPLLGVASSNPPPFSLPVFSTSSFAHLLYHLLSPRNSTLIVYSDRIPSRPPLDPLTVSEILCIGSDTVAVKIPAHRIP